MNVKRLLGSLAVAGTLTALLLGSAAPVFADSTITFTVSPNDGTEVPGKTLDPHGIQVVVTARPTNCTLVCSMGTLSFTIQDPDGNTVASGSAPPNSGSTIRASTTWDTQPTAKKNGNYTLVAKAAQGDPLGGLTSGLTSQPTETKQTTLKVNNPPIAPTGVQTTLDASGVPVVSWSANPEPDIKGYQVYRSDGALTSGLVAATSFRDAGAPTGQALSYKVAALRFSPVDPSGLIGSVTSAQTAAVTAPAPAAAGPQNAASGAANAGAGAGPVKQPVTLSAAKPAPIAAPTLPTRVVQLPQPNVVQFAPLLPYSGKVPEVPVNSNVPPPIAAQADQGKSTVVVMPGGANKVTPVDAIKYVAAAVFLIVAAVHVTRFARKLRNASV